MEKTFRYCSIVIGADNIVAAVFDNMLRKSFYPGLNLYTPYSNLSLWALSSLDMRGLGPTKLISPFRIFHSWGSSSRLVLRRILPALVIYWPGFSNSPVAQFGVLFFIVWNLYMVKGLPFLPRRS